ncbi:MAG: DUF6882 domain-containing protein [Cyanobacteria bacterium J06632_22]
MSPKFKFLLSRYAGIALAKQLALGDLLGQHSWAVDLTAGTVTFNPGGTFPLQILGTEATGDATWLWAWANAASQLPSQLLQACRQLQQLGGERNIPELCDRSFPLTVADGHMLASIASGPNANCCYYRGPYDGGALYFLVSDLPDSVLAPAALPRVLTAITQTLAQFDVDHLEMVQSFLTVQGFVLQQDNNTLRAQRQQDELHLVLDEQQRIQTINSTLCPV